ncbi:MAG: hypothetical protein ABIR91_02570 [Candidatus Saccharimonadales bacterium]
MNEGVRGGKRPEFLHFPPRELWTRDPKRDGLLPTPLNDNGLVDTKKLIEDVKSTVDPSYGWQSSFNDVHHLQWPNRLYERAPSAYVNPHAFRESNNNKVLGPRTFHNQLHYMTEPPVRPPDDAMHHSLQAQQAVMALYHTVKACRRDARAKLMSEQQRDQRLEQHFERFLTTLESAQTNIPESFFAINLADYQITTPEDLYRINNALARAAFIPNIVRQLTHAARV